MRAGRQLQMGGIDGGEGLERLPACLPARLRRLLTCASPLLSIAQPEHCRLPRHLHLRLVCTAPCPLHVPLPCSARCRIPAPPCTCTPTRPPPPRPPTHCSGLFGSKHLHADVLSSFTVKALEPVVWRRLAQAGARVRAGTYAASAGRGRRANAVVQRHAAPLDFPPPAPLHTAASRRLPLPHPPVQPSCWCGWATLWRCWRCSRCRWPPSATPSGPCSSASSCRCTSVH